MRSAKPWGMDDRAQAQRRARAAHRRQTARLTRAFERDPATGALRRGRVERVPRGLTLWLPKFLPSPNQWHWASWQTKARVKRAWEDLIRVTATDASAAGAASAGRTTPAGALGWIAPPGLVDIAISRHVISAAHFIRDDDNLAFAAKPLVDCLVHAGFLRGDSRDEIRRACLQERSRDGQPWTVVAITVPEEET